MTAGDGLMTYPSRPSWMPRRATTCEKCGFPRPERAHHCKVCDECVMRMDHHCPWINNCVGYGNYKHFLLLIAYALLGCLIGLGTSFPQLSYLLGTTIQTLISHQVDFAWQAAFDRVAGFQPSQASEVLLQKPMTVDEARDYCGRLPPCKGFVVASARQFVAFVGKWGAEGEQPMSGAIAYKRLRPQRLEDFEAYLFLVFGLVVCFTTCMVLLLVAGHGPLLVLNKTTIEFNYQSKENPYDCGSTLANMEQAIGKIGLDWLLPVQPWNPQTDGVAYPPYVDAQLGPGATYAGNALNTPEGQWAARYLVQPQAQDRAAGHTQSEGVPFLFRWLSCSG